MIIQTNIPAMFALREKKNTDTAIAKNLQKLSSGFRIRQAADDAAGLAVSEKMRAQITELERCELNVSEGIDIARTADGALEEVGGMLRRARELCLQASNGTYSDQERLYMSEEINQLFSEIEHITSNSRYNTIPLFRSTPTDSDDPVYLYLEEFNKVTDQQLWGEMDFVKDEDFAPAAEPKPATVTFQLADDIGMNYAIMLDKKSIKIGSDTYTFRADAAQNSYYTDPRVISLQNIQTVREAMEQLAKFSDIDKVDVDENTKTITLTGSLNSYTYPVEANGTTTNYTVQNGTGEWKNGWLVQNPVGKETIGEVDGNGISNNQPVYGRDLSFSLDLSNVTDPVDVPNLIRNSMSIYIEGATPSSASFRYDQIFTQTTGTIPKADFINAVVNKLRSTAPLNGANTTITYTAPRLEIHTSLPSSASSGTPHAAYISESVEGKIVDPAGPHWTTKPLSITTSSTPPSAEVGGTYTVQIPNISSSQLPFSFELGSYTHIFYDSTNPDTQIKTDGTTVFSTGDSYTNKHDISGMSLAEIRTQVVDLIKRHGSSYSASVKEQGNALVFSSNPNTSAYRFTVRGASVDVKTAKLGSNHVMPGGTFYFSQEVSVPFSVEKPFDASKLIGTGFGMDNGNGSSIYRWEFTDGTGLRSEYNDIDISGCSSFADLAAVMEAAIQSKSAFGNDCKVKVDESKTPASLTIQWNRGCTYGRVTVTDGAEGVSGIVKDGPVQFSGGTSVGHEQKILDFSSINTNNLDTLLGKGFRVNCATCEGEYINVYFCWENDGSAPPSFTHDVTINGQTVTRTIHNIPVELSKVTSGDQIVKSIVDQVKPSLNHYTDMEVGDPSTTLVIQDKRCGIVYDATTGQEYIGSVESGVYTNFTYTVTKEEIVPPEPPEGGLLDFRISEVMIYAGQDGREEGLIPIHLPFLSLTQLRLNPPKLVDLTEKGQDPLSLLKKVDCAHDSIADSRAIMGADYNRLEHTYQALTHTATNLTEAESRIRDADMAGLMMEKIKNDILSQPQQSIIAQASKRPELVLQLLH